MGLSRSLLKLVHIHWGSQMLIGTTQQRLDLFKDTISDFEETAGSHAKCKLLLSIKNTMSDRHIVQIVFLKSIVLLYYQRLCHHGTTFLWKSNKACLP